MQGAAREASEAPGLEAGREREAAEAACRANPAACLEVEDPTHVYIISVKVAQQLAGALVTPQSLSWARIGGDINRLLGIDFFAKAEAYIEEKAAGFSVDEASKWAYNFGASLGGCVYEAEIAKWGHPRNPHCWIFMWTNTYHVRVLGWTLFTFELPNFKKDPEVAYCPRGTSNCWVV